MARINGQSYNNSMFVAGTFDAFVKHQALSALSSPTKSIQYYPSEVQSALRNIVSEDSIPKAVESITNVLENNGNPLNDPDLLNDYDFAGKLNYYDGTRPNDNFDFDRAIEIAMADRSPYMHSLQTALTKSDRATAHDLMRDHLHRAVNSEIQASISSVSLAACLSPNGVSMESVMDRFHCMVTEPLNESIKFQNELPVKLVAMHEIKQSILTDYQNMDFLSKYGKQLSTSNLSPTSLQSLKSAIEYNGDTMPSSLVNLQVASLEHLDNSYLNDCGGKTYLPDSQMQLGGLLAREGVSVNSEDFTYQVLRTKNSIDEKSLSALLAASQLKQEARSLEVGEPKSLGDLLKEGLDFESPSMN